ncbi:MAG: FHA domain-containing protein [Chthoniobacter sp.]|nr:FHA domain-containing protein [Chthoniobacter sp.]
MPTLRIQMPDQLEVTHQLTGERITIGRTPDNTIQIQNPAVSARHAELIAEDGHYRLHDLESTNLTFVDGLPVVDFHLRQACYLMFGTVQCSFDPADGSAEEALMTREQLEKDVAFLRTENADLRARQLSLQRRLDMLSSARLVTGRTDSTPSAAAQDSLRAVVTERDDLRHTVAGLRLETTNLTQELEAANRERERLRCAIAGLQTEKVSLGRAQQKSGVAAVPPMNGAPIRPVPKPGALTSRDPGSALSALDPRATQRLALPLDAAFQPIADTLVALRSALDRVSGVPDDDFSRVELMTISTQLVDLTASLQDHPIARMAASVETLLHGLLAQPGAVEDTAARTVVQALDLLARLVEPRQVERAKTLPPASVLAVEEDAGTLSELVALLETVQLETTTCAGAGAVLAQACGRQFDLVLLDCDLAGPAAPALCAQLRGESAYRKTPIIFLTGSTAAPPATPSGLRGGTDFLAKPVNPAELAVKAQMWSLRNQFNLL